MSKILHPNAQMADKNCSLCVFIKYSVELSAQRISRLWKCLSSAAGKSKGQSTWLIFRICPQRSKSFPLLTTSSPCALCKSLNSQMPSKRCRRKVEWFRRMTFARVENKCVGWYTIEWHIKGTKWIRKQRGEGVFREFVGWWSFMAYADVISSVVFFYYRTDNSAINREAFQLPIPNHFIRHCVISWKHW